MPTNLDRWLGDGAEPADLYELLGAARFDPEHEQLIKRIRTLTRETIKLQNHEKEEVVQRAIKLQGELGKAEHVLSHRSELRAYHAGLLREICRQYEHLNENAAPWRTDQLQAWLKDEQRVHPKWVGPIGEALVSPTFETAVLGLGDTIDLPEESEPAARSSEPVAPQPAPADPKRRVMERPASPRPEPLHPALEPGRETKEPAAAPLPVFEPVAAGLPRKRKRAGRKSGFSPAKALLWFQQHPACARIAGASLAMIVLTVTGVWMISRGSKEHQAGQPTAAPEAKPADREVTLTGSLEVIQGLQGTPAELHFVIKLDGAEGAAALRECFVQEGSFNHQLRDYVTARDVRERAVPFAEIASADRVRVTGTVSSPEAAAFRLPEGAAAELVCVRELERLDNPDARVVAGGERDGASFRNAPEEELNLVEMLRLAPVKGRTIVFRGRYRGQGSVAEFPTVLISPGYSSRGIEVADAQGFTEDLTLGDAVDVLATASGTVTRADLRPIVSAIAIRPSGLRQDNLNVRARGTDLLAVSGSGAMAVRTSGTWRRLHWNGRTPARIVHGFTDRAGDCWLAGEGGLCRISAMSVRDYHASDGIPVGTISHVFEDARGRIWVSSWGSGIAVCRDGAWRKYTRQDGLSGDNCDGFAEDAWGRIWVASDRGVSICSGHQVRPLEEAAYRSRRCDSIAGDRAGRIYLGFDDGLLLVNGDLPTQFVTTSEGAARRTPRVTLVDGEERIWLGTGGSGVVRIDGQQFKVCDQDACPLAGSVRTMAETADGVLWVGSQDGLRCYSDSRWRSRELPGGLDSVVALVSINAGVSQQLIALSRPPESSTPPPASPSVPAKAGLETPDAAARGIYDALQAGDLRAFWNVLPEAYKTDVNDLIRTFAANVDSDVWKAGVRLVQKAVKVAQEKKDLILNHPGMANFKVPPEVLAGQWDSLVGILATIAASELTDLQRLKTFDVGVFLDGSGDKITTQLMDLAKADVTSLPEVPVQQLQFGRLKDANFSTVRIDGDTATVRIVSLGTSQDEEFVRVDGRWLPKEMVDDWHEAMRAARESLRAQMPAYLKENKMQLVMSFSVVETVLDQLLAAKTQSEFNQVIEQVQGSLLPRQGGIALPGGSNSLGPPSAGARKQEPKSPEPAKRALTTPPKSPRDSVRFKLPLANERLTINLNASHSHINKLNLGKPIQTYNVNYTTANRTMEFYSLPGDRTLRDILTIVYDPSDKVEYLDIRKGVVVGEIDQVVQQMLASYVTAAK